MSAIETSGKGRSVPLVMTGVKGAWRIDRAAIAEAAEILELTAEVYVMHTTGRQTLAAYYGLDRYKKHVVTLSRLLDADSASRALWHELTHASQRQRFGSDKEWHAAYKAESRRSFTGERGGSYDRNRYEVEARKNESLHYDLPLTVAR